MPPATKPKPKRRVTSRSRTTISDQLRAIVADRRLTAYALAQLADVSPSVVSRFLNRERGLSTATLDAICAALKLELKESRRGRAATGARKDEPASPTQD